MRVKEELMSESGRFCSRRVGLLVFSFSLFSAVAFAQVPEQVVTPDPVMQTQPGDTAVGFDVNYDSDDETLPGLGLLMFFDSTKLVFVNLTDVLSTDFIQEAPPADDTSDDDGDPNTDKFVRVAWADTATAWPGEGNTPTKLFTANFMTAADFREATKVNFGKNSPLDSVATFSSTSGMINPSICELMVSKAGPGSGTVTSEPSGIDCGSDCSEEYGCGTQVTLMQTTGADSLFSGWSGDCSAGGTVTLDEDKTCIATFDPVVTGLTLMKIGNGSGTVTSSPAGIDCGSICSANFILGQQVMLMPSPDANFKFVEWGGACSEDGKVTITDTPQECTAEFMLLPSKLTVTKEGDGDGTVTSDPPGIDCGGDCMEEYGGGIMVTLTGAPDDKSKAVVWGGDCDTNGKVTMDGTDKNCVATFNLKEFPLNAIRAGTGSGTVTSTPAGIDCGSDCEELFPIDTMVQLTATPDDTANAVSVFDGWSGDCDASGMVTMDAAKTCTANFTLVKAKLSITKSGNSSGGVTSDPAGIDCGTDCSEVYDIGTMVKLTPTADEGSMFVGWSGDCNSDGEVTINDVATCNAQFDLIPFGLSVMLIGDGMGTVSSAPVGIDCGSACMFDFDFETMVQLTATADDESNFVGWTGDCDENGKVTVTMASTCTAEFELITFILSVNHAGNGDGVVTSMPEGIDCGSDCSREFTIGTEVELVTTADEGSVFKEWTGDDDCADGMVTMDAAKSCTAVFNIAAPDHFLCYKTKPRTKEGDVVSLDDQFESKDHKVQKSIRLCNPADKNGEMIQDPEGHLQAYKIKRAKGEPKSETIANVQVENQFGTIFVDAKNADWLLVPTAKSLEGEPQPLDDSSSLDHYKCYKVKPSSGQSFPNDLQASVVDQFHQETLYDIKKPLRLCNPVSKNDEGIINDNDENHLLCYKIKRAKGEPRHQKVDGIRVVNQFGSGTLKTKGVKELCVPSTKQPIDPQ